MYVLNWTKTDTVAVLMDGYYLAGSYSFNWDNNASSGEVITNGVYWYELLTDSSKSTHKMLLNELDVSKLAETFTFLTSSSNGEISFPYSEIPLNAEFIRTGMESSDPIGKSRISNKLTFVVAKEGYSTVVEEILINPAKSAVRKFILKKN